MMELWSESPVDFALITLVLGGGAAYLVGRAVALTWRRIRALVGYIVLLDGAVRFIHFALVGDVLIAPVSFATDLVILGLGGALGFQFTRAAQIGRQYPWLYERTGPFTWRRRGDISGP